MKGSISVVVQNDRTKYEFVLNRNLTVVRGDSATGKTTLIDMIREHNLLGSDSGVELFCEKKCVVIDGMTWKEQLERCEESVIFIDEANRFVSTQEFAEAIQNTEHYYFIVTREDLPMLPYSVEEIYGIRTAGKYGGLKPAFHEIFHIYSEKKTLEKIRPDMIVTEDSNSGFQFFESMCQDKQITCISAGGKSNIPKKIRNSEEGQILVIADGAAFGPEMEKVESIVKIHPNISVYLPESFEWLILSSGCITDSDLQKMSKDWGKYIDSQKYFSWEQYFTELLIDKTRDTYLKYNKKTINQAYLSKNISSKILREMELIEIV